MHYLAKRGTTYYFRRPVPAELRPYPENRPEWMVSLGTKDRETANFHRCILTLRFQKTPYLGVHETGNSSD